MQPCVSRNFYQRCDDCPDEHACQSRPLFGNVREAMTRSLEHRTLANMLRSEQRPAPEIAAK
jgi:DNA-binding IscR family transcriptional regulator